MSGAPTPDGFTERQQQVVRRLIEQRMAAELARLRVPLAEDIRNLRLAITVQRDGTYPATGDTFAIRLLDCGFIPKSPGSTTQTCKERTAEHNTDDADDVIAREINGQYVPEGTYVGALWQRGLEGDPDDYGEWWIRLKLSGECWFFTDDFNRVNSTDVGVDWNETTGDANGDWEILAFQLHEEYGGNGTNDAVILGTNPVPVRSRGEMYVHVDVFDPNVNDVFLLYPCCDDQETLGEISVEYTYLGALVWFVEILSTVGGSLATATMTSAPILEGVHTLWVCADHNAHMIKAGVVSVGDEPAWEDNHDPGDGRYYAIGHDNPDTGATFDDFYVTELRTPLVVCTDCFCYCLDTPPTKTLHGEFANATGRAACLGGLGWQMDYTWGGGTDHWFGEVDIPAGDHGTAETLGYILRCDNDENNDPDWPGRNFTIEWATNRCCNVNPGGCGARHQPIAELSTCEPLHLVFGPFTLRCDDLQCNACWNALTPAKPPPDIGCDPDDPNYSGQFYIVVTE